MTELDKLIEAVEAGDNLPEIGHGYWQFLPAPACILSARVYHEGSLDDADALMTILPEGAKWMRMSDGAFIVWLPGAPISASAEATGNISRDLFLAILRAYRSVQA